MLTHFEPLLKTGNCPWLVEHIAYHLEHAKTDEEESEFDYSLNLLLDSMERIFLEETH